MKRCRNFIKNAVGAVSRKLFSYVGALVNGELQELTYPLYADSAVEMAGYLHRCRHQIYKRSLYFVLLAAVTRIFP
jgi:hypothetical protein